jgi:hypothetical protein
VGLDRLHGQEELLSDRAVGLALGEREGATLWTLQYGKLVHGIDFGEQADAFEAAGLND